MKDMTLIHELGHAKAVKDCPSKLNISDDSTSIVLIGNYKEEESFESCEYNEECNAIILYFESKQGMKRGLTLNKYFSSLSDEDLIKCLNAGYEAELSKGNVLDKVVSKIEYELGSSDKSSAEDLAKFKASLTDLSAKYTHFYNLYNQKKKIQS